MTLENFVIFPVWQSKMSRIGIQGTTNIQPSDFSLSYTTTVEHITLFNVLISTTPLQGKHTTPVLQMLRRGTRKLSDMLKTTQWTENWIQVSQIAGQCLDLLDIVKYIFLQKLRWFHPHKKSAKVLKNSIFSQFTKSSICQNLDKHLTEM